MVETHGCWPGVLETPTLQSQLETAKVLCVGAGGIGCELLKTLVLTGLKNIEVIDLDTIETSNLNRQFLFRRHHVGKSKAQTAADVVRGFKPDANIVAHYGNIKESRFDIEYFQKFHIVLNGLDNLEARRHVNRMCLAAGRPLIESGTAGYLGQVMPHLKGQTQCFECQPKPVPKSFPICTIRNTPDKPIHCIVWAKDLLFQRLFGPKEAVTDLDEQQQPTSDAASHAADGNAAADGAEDAPAAAPEDLSFFQRKEGEASLAFATRIFERLFKDDIERVCSMEDLWKSRVPPKPLLLSELVPDVDALAASSGQTAAKALGLNDLHKVWSTAENAAVLLKSIALFLDTRPGDVGFATFDKDDDLAVEIVTAASNLRSACYGIPTQALFGAKGMAGNIIHAIATTNAIVAGMIVVEALKVLAGTPDACRAAYLYDKPAISTSRGRKLTRLVQTTVPDPPRPGCMVCGKAQLLLRINTRTTTLAQLLDKVVRKQLAVNMPTLLCGDFMYEEGEGLEEDEVAANAALLQRRLEDLPAGGVRGGCILTVNDQQQLFSVDLVVAHQEAFDEEKQPEGFLLEGQVPVASSTANPSNSDARTDEATEPGTADAAGPSTSTAAAGPSREEDGVVMLIDDDVAPQPDLKRKRPVFEGQSPSTKKPKQHEDDGSEVIMLE